MRSTSIISGLFASCARVVAVAILRISVICAWTALAVASALSLMLANAAHILDGDVDRAVVVARVSDTGDSIAYAVRDSSLEPIDPPLYIRVPMSDDPSRPLDNPANGNVRLIVAAVDQTSTGPPFPPPGSASTSH